MDRRLLVAGAALALAAAIATGCSKSPTAPAAPATDNSEVNTTLVQAATLVDDGLAEDNSQVAASALEAPAGSFGVQAAIKPFAWWQNITAETRTWTLAFSDSDSTGHPNTCLATLVKHMTGELVVIPQSPTDSTQADTSRIFKPLDKTLTRKIMLKRIVIGKDHYWRVTEVTGAFVTTPSATVDIESLRVQSTSGVDTTITDPLQWESLRHVLAFTTNDSVTVTVTTSHLNDAVYIHRWDWRHRLRTNGDGTYTFGWVTSAWGGWRWFGIQAMTHGSIYDDTAPFDSQAWHFVFRVVGQQPAVDYYPQ